MRHIAISGMAGGKNVEWPEELRNDQYAAKRNRGGTGEV
jgi:hypothetical protein